MDLVIEPPKRKSSFLIRDILGETGNGIAPRSMDQDSEDLANIGPNCDHTNGRSTPDSNPRGQSQEKDQGYRQRGSDFVLKKYSTDPMAKSLQNIIEQESRFFQNILKQRLLTQEKEIFATGKSETVKLKSAEIGDKRDSFSPYQERLFKRDRGREHDERMDESFESRQIVKMMPIEPDEVLSNKMPHDARQSSPKLHFSNPNSYIGTHSDTELMTTAKIKKEKSWKKDVDTFNRTTLQPQNLTHRIDDFCGANDTTTNKLSTSYDTPPPPTTTTTSVSPDSFTSSSPPQPPPHLHPSTPSSTASLSPPPPPPPQQRQQRQQSPPELPTQRTFPSFQAMFPNRIHGAEKHEDRDHPRHSKQSGPVFASRETSSLPGTGPTRPLPHLPQHLACLRPATLPPLFPFRVSQHQGLPPGLAQAVTSPNRQHLSEAHLSPGHPCLGFPHLPSAGFLSRGEYMTVVHRLTKIDKHKGNESKQFRTHTPILSFTFYQLIELFLKRTLPLVCLVS